MPVEAIEESTRIVRRQRLDARTPSTRRIDERRHVPIDEFPTSGQLERRPQNLVLFDDAEVRTLKGRSGRGPRVPPGDVPPSMARLSLCA